MKKRRMSRSRRRLESTEYDARISKQRAGGYLVEFPELPGCLTEGRTVQEAKAQAREALSGWLYAAVKAGEDIPAPKRHQGRTIHRVAPDIDVAVPLLILWARKRRGLTQHQVAKALGVTQQSYRKLEIPGKSNPTVKTLSKLADVLDLQITLRAA